MNARTGEIHVRQDHVHEDIGLSPDDRQGESNSACSQEGDIEEPPGEHQLLRRHAVINVRNCGPGWLSGMGPPETGGGDALVRVGSCVRSGR